MYGEDVANENSGTDEFFSNGKLTEHTLYYDKNLD